MSVAARLKLSVEISGTVQVPYRPKLWTQSSMMIPRFVYESYPKYAEFLEAYLRFVEKVYDTRGVYSPGPYYLVSNLIPFRDVDTTTEQFISYFKSEYLVDYPPLTEIETRHLIKSIAQFYSQKGTVRSFEFFFRTVFDIYFNIYYPKVDILRCSDGKWYRPYLLRLRQVGTGDPITSSQILEIKDAEMRGEVSGATGFVIGSFYDTVQFDSSEFSPDPSPTTGFQGVQPPKFALSGNFSEVFEWLEVGNAYKRFVPGETIEFSLKNGQKRYYWVPTVSSNPYLSGIQVHRGYWINRDGFLSSDKYIQDNNYYQSFSYEIRTSKSLVDVLAPVNRNLHPIGLKVFARVTPESSETVIPYPNEWNFIEWTKWCIYLFNWVGQPLPDPLPVDASDLKTVIFSGQKEIAVTPDYSYVQENRERPSFSWQFKNISTPPASPVDFEIGDFENHVLVFNRKRQKMLGGGTRYPSLAGSSLNPLFNFYYEGSQNNLRTFYENAYPTYDYRRAFGIRTLRQRSTFNEVFSVTKNPPSTTGKLPYWSQRFVTDQLFSSSMTREFWAGRVLVFRNGKYVPYRRPTARTTPVPNFSFSSEFPSHYNGVSIEAGHDDNDIIEVIPLDNNVEDYRQISTTTWSLLAGLTELPSSGNRSIQDLLLFFEDGTFLYPGRDFTVTVSDSGNLKVKVLPRFFIEKDPDDWNPLGTGSQPLFPILSGGPGSPVVDFTKILHKDIRTSVPHRDCRLYAHYLIHNGDSFHDVSNPDETGQIPTVIVKAPGKWYDRTLSKFTVSNGEGVIWAPLRGPDFLFLGSNAFPSGPLQGISAYWNMAEDDGSAFDSINISHLTPISPPQPANPPLTGYIRDGIYQVRAFSNNPVDPDSGKEAFIAPDNLQVSNSSNELSISLWFKVPTSALGDPNSKRSGMTLMRKTSSVTESVQEYHLYIESRVLKFTIGNGSGSISVNTTSQIVPDIWNHVVVSCKSSGSPKVSMYLNGSLVSASRGDGLIPTGPNDTSSSLTVGASLDPSTGSFSRFFTGGMTMVGLWKRALTPYDVEVLYYRGRGRTFEELLQIYAKLGISIPGVTLSSLGVVLNPRATDRLHWLQAAISTKYQLDPPVGAPIHSGDKNRRIYFQGPAGLIGGGMAFGSRAYTESSVGKRIFALRSNFWSDTGSFTYGTRFIQEYEIGLCYISKNDIPSRFENGSLSDGSMTSIYLSYTTSGATITIRNGLSTLTSPLPAKFNRPDQTVYFAMDFTGRKVWVGTYNKSLAIIDWINFGMGTGDPITGDNPTYSISEWDFTDPARIFVPAARAIWGQNSSEGATVDLLVNTSELGLFAYHYGYGNVQAWGNDDALIYTQGTFLPGSTTS